MPPLKTTLKWFFRAETVTRGLVSLRRSRWRPNFNSSAYGSRVIGKTNKNYRNILHSVTDQSGFLYSVNDQSGLGTWCWGLDRKYYAQKNVTQLFFAFSPVFNFSNLLIVWVLLPKLILSIPYFTNLNLIDFLPLKLGTPYVWL